MFSVFFLPTFSFIVNLLSAFVCFMMAWVIFDSLKGSGKLKQVDPKWYQWFGYMFLGIYFLVGRSFELTASPLELSQLLVLSAAVFLSTGLYLEPTPTMKAGKAVLVYRPKKLVVGVLILPILFGVLSFAAMMLGFTLPFNWTLTIDGLLVLLFTISLILLFVKHITGTRSLSGSLTRAYFFLILIFLVDFFNVYLLSDLRFDFWTGSTGLLHLLGVLFTFVSFALCMGPYAHYFLRFRLQPAFFMNFFASSLFIFISVVVVFLVVLLNDIKEHTLANLEASGRAVQVAIDDLKDQSLLAAKALRSNILILSGVEAEEVSVLHAPVKSIFETSGADRILITNEAGLSLYDSAMPDQHGLNFSDDKYLLRALQGEATTAISTELGVLAPSFFVQTYLPIVSGSSVVGVVIVEFDIDDQLVDGIKEQTGLDATLFVNSTRSATTFVSSNDKQRLTGTLEENEDVLQTVLQQGQVYRGTTTVFNEDYLGVYLPFKDSDGNVVGMIFTGEPFRLLLALASDAVQETFRLMTLVVILSFIPNYFFARRAMISLSV